MVSRSVSLKKFIMTVVDQLPPYIEQYSIDDRKLLNNFRIVLQKCESKPDRTRTLLSKELEQYYQKIRQSKNYIETAFLWFVSFYFENANLLLNVTDYHAESYYTYLVKHLRTNLNLKGAFQLIREQIPLTDLRWELLQYACIEPPALTQVEYEILCTISRVTQNEGFESLNPSRVRTHIKNENDFIIPRHLNRFLNPIKATWFLWFFTQAFGIDEYIFKIELTDFEFFNQLFDYNDPRNTTLCRSAIYKDLNSTNTYHGTIYVPDHIGFEFINYIRNLESQGAIITHYLNKITNKHVSSSYNLYNPNSGWREIKPIEWQDIIKFFKIGSNPKNEKEIPSFLLSSQFNPNWNFRKHTNATHAIKVYSNFPHTFSFDTLPFGANPSSKLEYSIREKAHIKELHNNNVLKVIFHAYSLHDAFSLDLYMIKLPKATLESIEFLLSYLPFCNIFMSDSNIYLQTRLTQKIASKVVNDLAVEITPVVNINNPWPRTSNWFDFKNLQWKSPRVLK